VDKENAMAYTVRLLKLCLIKVCPISKRGAWIANSRCESRTQYFNTANIGVCHWTRTSIGPIRLSPPQLVFVKYFLMLSPPPSSSLLDKWPYPKSKSKSKSHYDRRLVSQYVLVSSPIWDF
jgi:hypothetical protein